MFTLRFLGSTRKLQHFVQRVLLCSKNVGFLMYFSLHYNTIENSAELCIVFVRVYILYTVFIYIHFIFMLVRHKLFLSLQNVQPKLIFLLWTFDSGQNLQSLAAQQTYRKYCCHFIHTELKILSKRYFAVKAKMRRLKHLFFLTVQWSPCSTRPLFFAFMASV